MLHKWYNNTLTEDELKEFKLRDEYDDLVKIKENTDHLETPTFDKEKMLTAILNDSTKNKPSNVIKLHWFKYAAAITILIASTIFFWPNDKITKFNTSHGDYVSAEFPDNSIFELQGNSSLKFDKETWSQKRIVFLEGNAIFEVVKGPEFLVKTQNGDVRVLGTKFEVNESMDTLEVSCYEGHVEVNIFTKKITEQLLANEKLLSVGESTIIQKSELVKLKSVTLNQLIQELQQTFDVIINKSNININEKLSCNFQKQNLANALETSIKTLGINYSIENNTVTLTK